MINVSKPNLPPLEDYVELLKGIWDRNWLTNNGPLVNALELKLKTYLDVNHMLYLNNGTIALQIAIKALDLKGEIITTPFSYVATTSSIVWEGCSPVFVDIDPDTLTINHRQIEAAITANTSGILATHVFGNPCNIEEIEKIALKHKLKVIYDAAHCFGTKYKGKSVFEFGDVSTTSFHATKLFHTIEGGAVFCNDVEVLKRMSYMRNFGHNGPEDFFGVGINGKNSEFHAAMGICNLQIVDEILKARKEICLYYNDKIAHELIEFPKTTQHAELNYAYYPIILKNETLLKKVIAELNANNILPRRYFYPSLDTLNYLDAGKMAVSNDVAARILCLPLYHGLTHEEVDFVCRIIKRVLNN